MAPKASQSTSATHGPCSCGRMFTTSGALKNHRNTCPKYRTTRRKPPENTPLAGPSNTPRADVQLSGAPSLNASRQLLRSRSSIPRAHSDIIPPLPLIIEDQEPGAQVPASPVSMKKTKANSFGVFRAYQDQLPTYTPDTDFDVRHICDNPAFNVQTPTRIHTGPDAPSPPGPYTDQIPPNNTAKLSQSPYSTKTEELFMSWYYSGGNTKSLNDMNVLAHNVIGSDDFRKEDLRKFDAAKSAQKLDNALDTLRPLNDGWKQSSVTISLPYPRHKSTSEFEAPVHKVDGLLHRSLTEIIKSAYSEKAASDFHTAPFEEYWRPSPQSTPERIYSELYNSDALLSEHQKIRQSPRPGCNLETVVMPMMLGSDSTQLTFFGDASLWPIYLHNGSQSKYVRSKPTSFSAHHVAYIPKLDDAIYEAYKEHFNDKPSVEILTHLRRELFQAVWRLLLDEEFMDAYENGIVLEFPDGIFRRVFPRFFTYSADYPEKVLLTCIKFLGNLPCPRCEISKNHIKHLGQMRDMQRRERLRRTDSDHRRTQVHAARRLIYEQGFSVKSAAVKMLLEDRAWTATMNAFSERLSPFGFDFYSMFTVDLLHEFELGVWKATFTHLIRILYVASNQALQLLNIRYRQIPSFGRAIRRFSSNASAMKRLAARDFEDLLQCAIPVFEGLLEPEHNRIVSDLLFELATWHGLAKLRLHTTSTVISLEASTTRLGDILRKFTNVTCSAFPTVNLPSEEAARARRKKGKEAEKQTSTKTKYRKFNLETYKLHALGDYASTIRMFGPTDGYSTQIGELEHRRCKKFYPRVHKGKKYYVSGVANHVFRERRMHNLGESMNIQMTRPNKKRRLAPTRELDLSEETIHSTNALLHFQISEETRNPVRVNTFLANYQGDPAIKEFLPRLRDHILGRLLNQKYDGDDSPFSDAERAEVVFQNHTIFQHKTLRVNYTTYDMRRDQDTINPGTNANIMMLSPEGEAHPYWYAKVIGIYHVLVSHRDLQSTPTLMNFLWVRWYGMEPAQSYRFGWKARRLPRIGFVDGTNKDPLASPPFGFIDPAHVIRAVHLIPAFHHGHTQGLLGPSRIARQPEDENSDWNFFYLNIFADRDMLMRFRGGGVGHSSTRKATDYFLQDRYKGDTHWYLQQDDTMEEDENEGDEGSTSESDEGDEGGRVMSASGGDSEDEVDEEEEEDYGYVNWNDEDEAEDNQDEGDSEGEWVDEVEDGIEEELGYAPY
ncbi:hypothetical protein CVT24_001579 [Panaeolus cyanescens]|uniref:C2H2-type domain-containing protein n=1 Tax=Panaeolus cyanescens TaxID=181874 RepID=A0A409WIX9_9AGAR|nr:hypothetical protein CVT24_001579 [Panaeolus cyanescens]